MFRLSLTLLLAVIFLSSNIVVHAQDDQIEYGDTVSGEITNREFEVEYFFTGSSEDVVIIEMKPVDVLGDLINPAIILLDEEADIIASVVGFFGEVRLASQLPEDGEYTIIATRADGRAGDSVGEYTLRLLNPPTLEVGVPVEATATSESSAYFVVDTGENFTVEYEKVDGQFNPQVSIAEISSNSELTEVAFMSGQVLSGGALSIDATSNDPYVVIVGLALFDFVFDEEEATFLLTLAD